MAIGRFRHKITLVGLFSGSDGYGGRYTGAAQNLLDTWADMEDVRGVRNETGSQVNHDKYTRFMFRYDPAVDITKAVYIMHESKTYTVQSYDKVNERTHYWEIIAAKSE